MLAWIICISHLPRNIAAILKQRRTKIGSPRADFFLLLYPSPSRIYTHRALLSNRDSLPRFSCPRYSKLAISLRITSPRASNREILISTTIFFHTYYYISLLFRESESGSFLRENRKKKSRVNTLHYIISQC